MQANEAILEKRFMVWPAHGEGASLEVMIDADGMLRITCADEQSQTYFGKMDISLEPEVASKVADAIKQLTNQGE